MVEKEKKMLAKITNGVAGAVFKLFAALLILVAFAKLYFNVSWVASVAIAFLFFYFVIVSEM